MNKKIPVSTILIISLFLIFLGVHNPARSDENGPGQGLRAITEDSIKQSSDTINHLKIEIACPQAISYMPTALRITLLEPTRFLYFSKLVTPANLPARASPPRSQLRS